MADDLKHIQEVRFPSSKRELAQLIDYANLSPIASVDDIRRLCAEARRYKFFGVCVNPCMTHDAKRFLKGSRVAVVTVVSFPFGCSRIETKLLEAKLAIEDGATEIDLVVNFGKLHDNDYAFVSNEVSQLTRMTKRNGIKLKAIIETSVLTAQQIRYASETVQRAGADFVKTNTGYGDRGASIEDVRLIHSIVRERAGIKASGGISDARKVIQMIRMGASRIGTSHGPKIVKTFHREQKEQ